MYATEAAVAIWLSSITDLKDNPLPFPSESTLANETKQSRPRKRRRLNTNTGSHKFPSPPASDTTRIESAMAPKSPQKRQRDPDDDGTDSAQSEEAVDDNTPRPNRFQQNQPQPQPQQWVHQFPTGSARSTSSLSSSVSSRSAPVLKKPKSVSSRTSPSRQIRNAQMNDTGFNTGSFILDVYPESLDKLLNELRDIAEGRGILPASLESKLPPRSRISPSAFDHDEATRSETEDTASFLPPFDWVKGMMKRAEECRINRECETSWNGEVHAPILQSVFRKSQFVSDGPVDFRWSQAAQIIAEYRPEEAPSKMIDFCVFYRPDRGSNVEQAIDDLCRVRPAQSINHTDLGDLNTRPVALSIETKRPGVEGDNAELQMGTWHSAQWRSLRQNRRGCLRSIEFLPGIIVQGHNWQFVASVVDSSGKSLLLTGERIGGTDSPMGIYSLLLALRRLRRWIMNEYWPMFLSDVLDISSQDTPA